MSGAFVTIDGPNGSGKSSICRLVAQQLESLHIPKILTREPTDTELGQFARRAEEHYSMESLACLMAADRYHHLQTSILPALKKGLVVICDRYVESSLVFQRMDDLPLDFIWNLHARIHIPDLSVILHVSPTTIAQRLAERPILSRFERQGGEQECQYYQDAAVFLQARGYNVCICENEYTSIQHNAETIVTMIRNLLSR